SEIGELPASNSRVSPVAPPLPPVPPVPAMPPVPVAPPLPIAPPGPVVLPMLAVDPPAPVLVLVAELVADIAPLLELVRAPPVPPAPPGEPLGESPLPNACEACAHPTRTMAAPRSRKWRCRSACMTLILPEIIVPQLAAPAWLLAVISPYLEIGGP